MKKRPKENNGTFGSPRCFVPVAPAVSKSLHSHRRPAATWTDVRLPPQSPSRYIRSAARSSTSRCPVAPAVSKSLHSAAGDETRRHQSGCPRSLQVATFSRLPTSPLPRVRLPPQSPSRYIRGACGLPAPPCPVAPAVSKSLHSSAACTVSQFESGCPRSLQVATFAAQAVLRPEQVRLPPQSPSRYIRRPADAARLPGPVAPAVSKSLHSVGGGGVVHGASGCPRSLQVATFSGAVAASRLVVRLPPQSPSRYIRRWCVR